MSDTSHIKNENPNITPEFPAFSSIDELLLDLDEETRADYIQTDEQVKSTLQILSEFDLPPAKGPPPPPPFISNSKDNLTTIHSTKKRKSTLKKLDKRPEYLVSTKVIQTQNSKIHESIQQKPLADPAALERLLKKKLCEDFPIYKEECFVSPVLDTNSKPWRTNVDSDRLIKKEKKSKKCVANSTYVSCHFIYLHALI